MVNLLVSVILSGLAVTFAIEFLSLALGLFLDKETIYNFLSLPASFGALVCLSHITLKMVVSVPATAFLVLVTSKWLNKPVVINNSRRQLPRF